MCINTGNNRKDSSVLYGSTASLTKDINLLQKKSINYEQYVWVIKLFVICSSTITDLLNCSLMADASALILLKETTLLMLDSLMMDPLTAIS